MPIGPWELAIILVIVIIIFGAGKLPEIGGALGRGIREFKESARDDEEEEEQQEQQAQQQQQYAQQQYGQQYPQQQYAQQPQAPPAEPQYHNDPNAAPQQGQPGEQSGGSGEPARRDA